MDATIRLRIATRIHFALLRHYGEHVDVAGLLCGDAEAREALWVCEGSGHSELADLARQFNDATQVDAREARRTARQRPAGLIAPPAARRAPQDAAWAQETSGFSVSRGPAAADTLHATLAPAGWQVASRWLRRAAGR